MNLTEHFTLEELIHSTTAQKYSINNTPNKYIISNLTSICKYVMEPIRQRYGKPIIVTSGYRCPRLNKLVGGVYNSLHTCGLAIDVRAKDGNNKELWDVIFEMISNDEINTRTVILEKCNNTKTNCQWIHIDINSKYHSYRKNKIIWN